MVFTRLHSGPVDAGCRFCYSLTSDTSCVVNTHLYCLMVLKLPLDRLGAYSFCAYCDIK